MSRDLNWMDGTALAAILSALMMPPRPRLTVVKLADHGGQYVIMITCPCGHTRTARPRTLAGLMGWEAKLEDVLKRLRCSKCGKRECSATVRPETKRDG